MLALSTKRQHLPQQHYSPTIPSPPSSHQLSYQQLPQQFAAQQFFVDEKLLHDYLESQQQSFGTPASSAPDSLMTSAFDFANPAIRIQQSTPTPQLPQNGYSQAPMLSTSATSTGLESWNPGHHRAASSSSVGSSASQYQAVGPSTGYQGFTNHLPTPTHTPTQDSS